MTMQGMIFGAAMLGGIIHGAQTPAKAQALDPFVGQVSMFAFKFCPRGWAKADGKLLEISANDALFSLYGTIYGGDGRTTFALPKLNPGLNTDTDAPTVCVALQGTYPSRN